MSSVYAANRELVDDEADRLFFVRDGVEQPITGAPNLAEPPVHPDHEERGTRRIEVGDAVFVEPDDLPPVGERIWLKGFGPVRRTDEGFTYIDDGIEIVREEGVDVIHWVPADGSVPLRLRTTDGDEIGRAEPEITDYEADELVQFERIGFARIDRHDNEETVAYFAHP
jgi:glutamyl-tRNA synthetase